MAAQKLKGSDCAGSINVAGIDIMDLETRS